MQAGWLDAQCIAAICTVLHHASGANDRVQSAPLHPSTIVSLAAHVFRLPDIERTAVDPPAHLRAYGCPPRKRDGGGSQASDRRIHPLPARPHFRGRSHGLGSPVMRMLRDRQAGSAASPTNVSTNCQEAGNSASFRPSKHPAFRALRGTRVAIGQSPINLGTFHALLCTVSDKRNIVFVIQCDVGIIKKGEIRCTSAAVYSGWS